jgi:hypothetical protein
MKKIFYSIILILSITHLSAQKDTSSTWKNMIRLSIGTKFNTLNPFLGGAYSLDVYNLVKFGLPTISYIRKTRNNDFHEANINNIYFSINKNRNNFNYYEFSLGASYLYNISFIRKKQTLIQPFIGFGSNITYSKNNNISYIDLNYINSNNIIQLQLMCAPRVQINIKKHLNIELSIPFDFFGYSSIISSSKEINNNTSYYRHQSTPYFGSMDININLGIGYKF